MQGPGKSWNFLGNDADADAKICAFETVTGAPGRRGKAVEEELPI